MTVLDVVDTRTAEQRLTDRLLRLAAGNGLDLSDEELEYLERLLRDETTKIGRTVLYKITDRRAELAGQRDLLHRHLDVHQCVRMRNLQVHTDGRHAWPSHQVRDLRQSVRLRRCSATMIGGSR